MGGVGEDRNGVAGVTGADIDPTKNVLDLVNAESKYQNGMRDAFADMQKIRIESAAAFQDAMRDSQSQIQNWMRDSEMKRIAEKETIKQFYETRIADMLRTSVESTSTLVSTQLVQIQNTFNDRVSQLEKFRYEFSGRSSVADPAITEAMSKMALAISSMQSTGSAHDGRTAGRGDVAGWVAAGVITLLSLISVVVAVATFFMTRTVPHP